MYNTINSGISFNGKLTTDIVLRNAQNAKRLENIAEEYAKATANKSNSSLHLSESFSRDKEGTILSVYGKDILVMDSIEDFMEKMSDAEIVKKLVKISDYLKLKFQSNKTYRRLTNNILDLEGKVQVNQAKAQALSKSGNEVFAKRFAKLAELNSKTLETLRKQREECEARMTFNMERIAGGDKEILDDMV